MNIAFLYQSFFYITSDPFFWPSMSFTTLIGIFIGSVIYDGDMEQIRKALITLCSYCFMLLTVTTTRIMPTIPFTTHPERPFAGVVTIFLVTIFYILGMFLGVFITRKAHNHKLT
jgi:RsiW-degrading membrane proteinase PrsW (M82 family)